MKKIIIATAAVTMLFCTACTAAPQAPVSETTASTAVQTTEAVVRTEETAAVTEQTEETPMETDEYKLPFEADFSLLKAGTWLANAAGEYRYFFFNADGETGSFVSPESGIGLAFRYENDDDRTIFYFGAADNASPAVLMQSDENNALLKWDEGVQETLTYVSDASSETFTFYTNDELCDLAISHYIKESGSDADNLAVTAQTNEDGTVTIHLFSDMETHTATIDWYTVDRTTAVGTDFMEGPIDLK